MPDIEAGPYCTISYGGIQSSFLSDCTKKIVASCITEVFGAMIVEDNIPNIRNPTEPPCYDTQSLCGFSLQRRPLALCMRPNGNINRQRKGFF